MSQKRSPQGGGSGQEVRAAAARALAPVLSDQGSLAGLDEHSVVARDRGLLKELCFGTCRRLPRLEALAGVLLKQPFKKTRQRYSGAAAAGYLPVAVYAYSRPCGGRRNRWRCALTE